MSYKVVMNYSDGAIEEDDEIFETELEADERGMDLVASCHEGAEIQHMSNPGDYPFDNAGDVSFEIIEV